MGEARVTFDGVTQELIDPLQPIHVTVTLTDQAKGIYIADASTWRALPSKAPTLTIMANASRVGKKVLENFPRASDNILK